MRKGDNVLSQTAEYALRATLFLARHTPGRTATALTAPPHVPPPITRNYATKVIVELEVIEKTMEIATASSTPSGRSAARCPAVHPRARGRQVEFHLKNHPTARCRTTSTCTR
jgi:hypothetical protein